MWNKVSERVLVVLVIIILAIIIVLGVIAIQEAVRRTEPITSVEQFDNTLDEALKQCNTKIDSVLAIAKILNQPALHPWEEKDGQAK